MLLIHTSGTRKYYRYFDYKHTVYAFSLNELGLDIPF